MTYKRRHSHRHRSKEEPHSSPVTTNPASLPEHVRTDSPEPSNPHSLLLHPKAKSSKPDASSGPSIPASSSRPSKPAAKSGPPIKKPPVDPPTMYCSLSQSEMRMSPRAYHHPIRIGQYRCRSQHQSWLLHHRDPFRYYQVGFHNPNAAQRQLTSASHPRGEEHRS